MQHRAIIVAALGLAWAGAAAAAPGDPANTDQPTGQQQSYPTTAGEQQPTAGQQQTTASQQTHTSEQAQLQLASAEDLVGKTVTTRSGERVGSVKYLTINLSQGSVSHLIVDTSDGGIAGSGEQQGTSGQATGDSGRNTGQAADTVSESTGQSDMPGQSSGQTAGTAATRDTGPSADVSGEAVGRESEAVGRESEAVGRGSEAVGRGSEAVGQESEAVGQESEAVGQESEAVGQESEAAGRQSEQAARVAGRTASAGQLLILPWTVVQVNEQTQQLETSANAEQLANAPRLESQELSQLTEPTLLSYVVDYWAPVSDVAAFESQRQQGEEQSQTGQGTTSPQRDGAPSQQGSTSDGATPYGRQDQSTTDAYSPDPSDQAGADPRQPGAPYTQSTQSEPAETGPFAGRSTTTGSDPQAAQRGAPPQGQSTAGQAGQQEPFVLVGQGVVTDVVPPMFHLSEQLRGATVQDQNGQTVGEIRRIFIDQQSGRAAYAVVENRSSGQPAPVPLAALEWSAEQGGSTVLSADAASLQADQTLTQNPQQVRREDLAQLYQRFGTTPYWEADSTSRGVRAPLDHQ